MKPKKILEWIQVILAVVALFAILGVITYFRYPSNMDPFWIKIIDLIILSIIVLLSTFIYVRLKYQLHALYNKYKIIIKEIIWLISIPIVLWIFLYFDPQFLIVQVGLELIDFSKFRDSLFQEAFFTNLKIIGIALSSLLVTIFIAFSNKNTKTQEEKIPIGAQLICVFIGVLFSFLLVTLLIIALVVLLNTFTTIEFPSSFDKPYFIQPLFAATLITNLIVYATIKIVLKIQSYQLSKKDIFKGN